MTPASAPAPLPENERVLLLLGLLTAQDRHGYEINDFIERQLSCVIHLKKATAYQLLDRLEQHGLIRSHTEQHGARPTRKVYALTPAGHARFLELLAAGLPQEEPLILPGSVALMFSDHLPPAQRLAALQQREAKLMTRLDTYRTVFGELPLSSGAGLTVDRVRSLTQADLAWTRGAIRQLQQELTQA